MGESVSGKKWEFLGLGPRLWSVLYVLGDRMLVTSRGENTSRDVMSRGEKTSRVGISRRDGALWEGTV